MTNVCYKCKEPLNNAPQTKHGIDAGCFKEWFNLADEGEDFQNLSFERTPQEVTDVRAYLQSIGYEIIEGFKVLARGWVVERTFAWIGL